MGNKKWVNKSIPSFTCNSTSPPSMFFFLLRQRKYTNVPRLIDNEIQRAAITNIMTIPATTHLYTTMIYYLATFGSIMCDF